MRRSRVWRVLGLPRRSVTCMPSLPPGARPRTGTICKSRAVTRAESEHHQGSDAAQRGFVGRQAHRRNMSAPRAGTARAVRHWGDRPALAESDDDSAEQQSHTRDSERKAVWKAEPRTACLAGKRPRSSQGQEGGQGRE